jgi:hypothetical protein
MKLPTTTTTTTAIEGKAALFKQFGGADARPVVLDTPRTPISSWRLPVAGYTALA